MVGTRAFWSTCTGSLLWAGSLLADPSAADRATARSLAGDGYQALQSKDYATAVDRFSRADALVHAPTLMIDWARALVGSGKLVEAEERYEQVIREGVDAKAPKSWQRALNDAQSEVALLKPRLAWITITTSGGSDVRVTIDGVAVPAAALGVRRAVNPGSREVAVTSPGFLPRKMALDLVEGGDATASFTLQPDPDAQPEPPPPKQPEPARPEPRAAHDPTLMYVAFGVGAAGFITGGLTGALALSRHSQLAKICDSSGGCHTDQSGAVSAYDTLGTVSGVGFAVGVAGVGSGIALWLLNRDKTPAPTGAGVRIRPYIGVASLGALGTF